MTIILGEAIRCYCNEPSCVRTGYMCKSTLEICFSQRTSTVGDGFSSRHACAEMLPVDERATVCGGVVGLTTMTSSVDDRTMTRSKRLSTPGTICCRADMCNYGDGGQHDVRSPNGGHLSGTYWLLIYFLFPFAKTDYF